jgi:hypothetical protein
MRNHSGSGVGKGDWIGWIVEAGVGGCCCRGRCLGRCWRWVVGCMIVVVIGRLQLVVIGVRELQLGVRLGLELGLELC